MRVLWEEGESSVARVHEALCEPHRRALTTIATMLQKMERKGVVRHRAEGRLYLYEPTVTEPDVHRTMVDELTDRLFQGDAAALVTHLITQGDVEPGELERLRRLIAERQGRRHDG